ncbi:MAG: HAD family hydrolase [Syntrophomonadaceae bacterium]|nr:HAD family hydrolase [Syntrophomonadaceae bacterium]
MAGNQVKMAIRLLAIDLDDTLLDHAGLIPARALAAVRAAKARGLMVTIATGRMFRAAQPYAELLQLELPLICHQGALLMDRHRHPPLWNKPVPVKPGQDAIELLRQQKVYYHGYFEDDLYTETVNERNLGYARHIGVELKTTPDLSALMEERPAMEIMAVLNPRRIDAMESALKERFGHLLHISRFRNTVLEVMHPEARKEAALKALAERLGVERGEVLAVGDNYNDLEMIKWAGVGVAVANAEEKVKAAADWICPSNEEGGVADALQRFFED